MKILFFLSAFPFPIDDGIKKIVDNLIREALKEHQVSLVVPHSEHSLEYEKSVEIIEYKKSRNIFSMLGDLCKLQPLYFSLYYDETVLEKIDKEKYDLIFYDFYPMTQYSSGLSQELFMMPDSMKLLAKSSVENASSSVGKVYHWINFQLSKAYNKKIETLKKLYVSQFDIDVDNLKNSFFIKIPADEKDFTSYWKTPQNKNEISFRGVMSFEPNISAVMSFYKEIYEELKKRYPKVEFRVIGKDPSPEITSLEGVDVTGFVDDPLLEMSRSYIHVVPMVSGSGVKTKLLDSFALKRLVFTNPKGINGIFDSIEEARANGVIVYESKKEFFRYYSMVLNGEINYQECVEKAYLFIKQNSYKKLLHTLVDLIK